MIDCVSDYELEQVIICVCVFVLVINIGVLDGALVSLWLGLNLLLCALMAAKLRLIMLCRKSIRGRI